MSQTVDGAFAELDHNLNLDPNQRQQAQERHNTIRDCLADAGFVASSFLQGSFARKTMLAPLKDVDIVVVLKPEHWEKLEGPDGPATAMAWFRRAVARSWPEAEFDKGDAPSGKALRVTYPDLDFDIDLVPAFELDGDNVLIGDRDQRHWEPSNTRRQIRAVANRNQATGGRFVHQVRQLKALIKNHDETLDFVKGIVVESLVYGSISRKVADKRAIVEALEHAKDAVSGAVIEPAGDDDVTVKWTSTERAVAVKTFTDFATRAREAHQLENDGDIEASIDVWHSLFGEYFPAAGSRTPEAVLGAWNTVGSRTSTGRPSTFPSGRQPTRPGRAWAPF
ncbi:nucleotidyltransferase [Rhodococcus sp. MEB032]|uniref:nucleotidyltransferase domain-containing protein n=1 Tax=Rhodococcus sp. MEB032 TaxID=3040322 RepID=UPI00254E62D4|nr:nucleotidyltransferase [Rhodococcus sp. MEB032]